MWLFLDSNWIVNNFIFTCIGIFVLKVFKFTSLKTAVISFAIILSAELLVIILIFYVSTEKSYNNVLLNYINLPFELQAPNINGIYNTKCSWLPLTAIIFPGMLFSYFRRFDTSRGTKLYLIIGLITFVIGASAWVVLSLAIPFALPFGFIIEPAACGLTAAFAYKRK